MTFKYPIMNILFFSKQRDLKIMVIFVYIFLVFVCFVFSLGKKRKEGKN